MNNLETFTKLFYKLNPFTVPEDILDILWFAFKINPDVRDCSEVLNPLQPGKDDMLAASSPETGKNNKEKPGLPKKKDANNFPPITEKEPESIDKFPDRQDIFPLAHGHKTGTGKAVSIVRAPNIIALPERLDFYCALYPLRKKKAAVSLSIIDEELTAQQIAETQYNENTGFIIPYYKAEKKSWIEMILLIEESESMALWKKEIAAFINIIAVTIPFKYFNICYFNYNNSDETLLFYKTRKKRGTKPIPFNINEFCNSSGLRIMLILSDCLSPAWHRNIIQNTLKPAIGNSFITLVQVLPEQLWNRTALCQTHTALTKNYHSFFTSHYFTQQKEAIKEFNFPVITMTCESLSEWAKEVIESSPQFINHYWPGAGNSGFQSYENKKDIRSAELLFDNFKLNSLSLTRKLAGYFSVIPLTLSTLKLVQRLMLPESSTHHLAEFLFSGLIEKKQPDQTLLEDDEIEFLFKPGIESLLQEELNPFEKEKLEMTLVKFFEHYSNINFSERVLWENPGIASELYLNEESRAITNILVSVLRFLLPKKDNDRIVIDKAKTIAAYNICIASFGDTKYEREIFRITCEDFNNRPLVKDKNIRLAPLGWEDVMPQAGDPQAIINQVAAECDLLICLFHKRFGSPTTTHESGTLEKFLNAYEQWKKRKKPQIILYFKKIELISLADFNDRQLKKVLEFKALVQKDRLILYKDFKDTVEFAALLDTYLQEWINSLEILQPDTNPSVQTEHPPADIAALYKSYILEQCRYMNIDALREDTKALLLRLPEVYIPLYTTAHGKTQDRQKQEKGQLVDIEQLISDQASLVIKGEAGCGKTTLLKHIAWSIINGKNRYGLNNYLPVLIYLRDFKWILQQPLPEPCARIAEEFLTLYLEKKDCGLTFPVLKNYCTAGRMLLLLDGLDEVEDRLRDCLVQAFTAFAGQYPSLKLVYSGRPHGISGALLKHYNRQVREVLPFNEEQMAEFVRRWWQEVHEGDKSTWLQQVTQGLINDLVVNPDIADLKGNPLMLTAICFLYLDDKRLPDQRAELYDRFVRRLLVNRFPEEHKRLLQFFMELAHSMFIRGDKEIDRYRALQIFTPYNRKVEGMYMVDAKIWIEENFDWVEMNSGLMRNQNNIYSFSHLSLQEFLTAAYIMDNVKADHKAEIMPHLNDVRYENVIRLYIGLLSVKGNKGIANQLVENMLQAHPGPGTWLLAGSTLLDIHKELCDEQTKALAVSKMEEIITARAAPPVLSRAGELLGRLGDRRDLKVFVKVRGGKYQLAGSGQVQLQDFAIGKYPVTNSWYWEFMIDGGYTKEQYWTAEGWDWRTKEEVTLPKYWHDGQFNCPNAPVVGVSWYEAAAFTHWLTEQLQDGHTYRLPVEVEWQLAAGGREQTVYPWGNNWDNGKCNNGELKLGKTTAVGIFKAGSTPVDDIRAEGISDMAGNVWEWTDSFYDKHKDTYTLRGGAWVSDNSLCRCDCRNGSYHPDSRNSNLGFRCAFSNSQFK